MNFLGRIAFQFITLLSSKLKPPACGYFAVGTSFQSGVINPISRPSNTISNQLNPFSISMKSFSSTMMPSADATTIFSGTIMPSAELTGHPPAQQMLPPTISSSFLMQLSRPLAKRGRPLVEWICFPAQRGCPQTRWICPPARWCCPQNKRTHLLTQHVPPKTN